MARRKAPAIPDEMLDQLLSGASASTAFDQGGLLDQLKKALAERALNAEMDHHLAGEGGARNSRNGYGRKSVVTDTGRIALEIPRDRQGSFDPVLIAKYQRRFPGFDEKIVSMYARGMSTREIAGHLEELYGIEVSPDLVSTVTDAVLDEIAAWQARPLEPVYPLVFFDALRVKIRDEGLVRNKAVHIALGVRADGTANFRPRPYAARIAQRAGSESAIRIPAPHNHHRRITPHIGVAAGQEDPRPWCRADHGAASATRTRRSAAPSTSAPTRTTAPPASTISIWPDAGAVLAWTAGGCGGVASCSTGGAKLTWAKAGAGGSPISPAKNCCRHV